MFASYLPVTPAAWPVTSETGPLPLDYSKCVIFTASILRDLSNPGTRGDLHPADAECGEAGGARAGGGQRPYPGHLPPRHLQH